MKLIHNILSTSGRPRAVKAAGQPFPNSGGVVVAFSNCQLSIVNCTSSTFHSKFSVLYSKFSFSQGFLYAPFGEITTVYNSTFGNDIIPKYSFNAKELDEETGMYYYEARYYKPPVFTSRDPMMDQKPWLTPYHYCSNNPVGRLDPSGMLDDEWEYNMGTQRWTWRSSKGRDIGVDIVHVTSGNGNSMGSYVCENGLSSCNCYGNVTDHMGFHMESFRIIDGNNSASFTYSISATPLNENTTSDSKWMNCIGEVALGTSLETFMVEEAAKSSSKVSEVAKEVEAEKVFSKVSKLAKWEYCCRSCRGWI